MNEAQQAERRAKIYNEPITKYKKDKAAFDEKTSTMARQTAIRHRDEENARAAGERDARAALRHSNDREHAHWAERTGMAKPADLDDRHKRERAKLETQLAKARDEMEKRHGVELQRARAEDEKSRR